MTITCNIPGHVYDIRIERGLLPVIGEEINLNRKVLVVTDKNVPKQYAETVMSQCKTPVLGVIEGGEDSKSLESFAYLQKLMLENGFNRKDCVVAVGGGVVGDLAGFAASAYMRGIDFYNVPTTVLSQVDSSIGGKTAVNFNGVKNIVGAFYQPKKVVIDPDVLNTLSKRQISNGLAEAIKMALTFDADKFRGFEETAADGDLTQIIADAIELKRKVVEEDEKEQGLRKVLNFGHTLGHGIEVSCDGKLLHGESVALGMTVMCSDEVKERLLSVLEKFELPTTFSFDLENALTAVSHDKKSKGDTISAVFVEKVGSFEIRDITLDEAEARLKTIL